MIAESEGQMQRDYFYDVNRIGEALIDPQTIGRRAAERAVRRLGARPIPTCEVPVLFAPELATGLFSHFIAAISGGNLYRKASYLEDALGQTLFPEWLSLDERPHIPRALGSASYDGDGLATYAKPFVENGRLISYVLSTYSGRKLGMPSTANAGGVHNLFVSHGEEDQAALLRRNCARLYILLDLAEPALDVSQQDWDRDPEEVRNERLRDAATAMITKRH